MSWLEEVTLEDLRAKAESQVWVAVPSDVLLRLLADAGGSE